MNFTKSIPLPNELTNLILEFSGYHKLRNGKYMKQITEENIKIVEEKIQMMPKIRRGYVKLKLPLSDKRSKEITTIILLGPSCDYINIGGRL